MGKRKADKDELMLDPMGLELIVSGSSGTWKTFRARCDIPSTDIKAGFLDGCMDNGLAPQDIIELRLHDGLVMLSVTERNSFGIGFAVLQKLTHGEPYTARTKPRPVTKPAPAPVNAEPDMVIEEFELSKEDWANGWTPELKAEFIQQNNPGIKAVFVGKEVAEDAPATAEA